MLETFPSHCIRYLMSTCISSIQIMSTSSERTMLASFFYRTFLFKFMNIKRIQHILIKRGNLDWILINTICTTIAVSFSFKVWIH